jgi:transposase
MIHDHGRKNYTEEFRRQAVDLYRSTPGATLRGIAADLGISRHTLQVWVHALDPDPSSPSCEPAATQGRQAGRPGSAEAELAELRARVAALETENAQLMVEQTKLGTERDILRQAARYFAGETNW